MTPDETPPEVHIMMSFRSGALHPQVCVIIGELTTDLRILYHEDLTLIYGFHLWITGRRESWSGYSWTMALRIAQSYFDAITTIENEYQH